MLRLVDNLRIGPNEWLADGVSVGWWCYFDGVVACQIANYWTEFLVTPVGLPAWTTAIICRACDTNRHWDGVLPTWLYRERAMCGPMWWRLFVVTSGLLVIMALIAHLSVTNLVYCSFALAFLVYHYFIMVNPLPPGTSKVQEWFMGFYLRRAPIGGSA
jgi:hypothetical protein